MHLLNTGIPQNYHYTSYYGYNYFSFTAILGAVGFVQITAQIFGCFGSVALKYILENLRSR